MDVRTPSPNFGIERAWTIALDYARRFFPALLASARKQSSVLVLVIAYWICGMLVAVAAGVPPSMTIGMYLPTYIAMMPFMIFCLLAGRGIIIMAVERPTRPLSQMLHEMHT